jgi:hemoglobin
MSTALLHYGANERKHIMLEKLGGQKVLAEATDKFYDRQVKDERLLKFFRGTDLAILKWHQFNLMSIAFTEVPESFDARHLILNRHQRLFDEGLDESYFDVVVDHFTGTLTELNVDPALIEDARYVILPLREVFVLGALEAKERKRARDRQRLIKEAAYALIVATVAFVAFKALRKLKK